MDSEKQTSEEEMKKSVKGNENYQQAKKEGGGENDSNVSIPIYDICIINLFYYASCEKEKEKEGRKEGRDKTLISISGRSMAWHGVWREYGARKSTARAAAALCARARARARCALKAASRKIQAYGMKKHRISL